MTTKTVENEIRTEVEVRVRPERAFDFFIGSMHDWWPQSYRLEATERTDVVIDPYVGGRWYEQTKDGREADWGDVLVWDPPHHLVLSWRIGIGFVPEDDPNQASQVDVRFEGVRSEQTIVTVVHNQFERHGADWQFMVEDVSGDGGWPTILDGYAELLHVQ